MLLITSERRYMSFGILIGIQCEIRRQIMRHGRSKITGKTSNDSCKAIVVNFTRLNIFRYRRICVISTPMEARSRSRSNDKLFRCSSG